MMIISIDNGLFGFFIVVRIVFPHMHYPRFYHHQINQSIVLHSITCMNSNICFQFSLNNFSSRSLTTESTSLITITTHEFLLHTLISGDYLLKTSITHLIIDDVHKRSHTLDMLLAYFKDAQQKFRHLKIIFIQTTMQYDALVKYFGNVATYTSNILKRENLFHVLSCYFLVEMKNKEIEERFLDEILLDIEHFDRNKCLAIGKKSFISIHPIISLLFLSTENYGIELLNHWCTLAEQSSRTHRISSSIICESCEKIHSTIVISISFITKSIVCFSWIFFRYKNSNRMIII